jgi:hypothetical protein
MMHYYNKAGIVGRSGAHTVGIGHHHYHIWKEGVKPWLNQKFRLYMQKSCSAAPLLRISAFSTGEAPISIIIRKWHQGRRTGRLGVMDSSHHDYSWRGEKSTVCSHGVARYSIITESPPFHSSSFPYFAFVQVCYGSDSMRNRERF